MSSMENKDDRLPWKVVTIWFKSQSQLLYLPGSPITENEYMGNKEYCLVPKEEAKRLHEVCESPFYAAFKVDIVNRMESFNKMIDLTYRADLETLSKENMRLRNILENILKSIEAMVHDGLEDGGEDE